MLGGPYLGKSKRELKESDLLGENGKFFNTMFTNKKNEKVERQKEVTFEKEKDEVKIELTETISEISANDFGYFTLKNNVKQDGRIIKLTKKEELKEELKGSLREPEDKRDKFSMTEFNLVKFFNENVVDFNTGKKHKMIDSTFELTINLGKDDSDWSKLKLADPAELSMNYFKKNPLTQKVNRSNTVSIFEAGGNEKDDDFLVKNTENSFIVQEQIKQIGVMNEYDEAFKKNYNYKNDKIKYDYVLLKRIINKFRNYQSGDSNIKLNAVDVYYEMNHMCGKFIDEMEAKFEQKKPVNYVELKRKSRNYLIKFINSIKNFYKLKTEKGNFLLWKKKLSELTNIWDLYSSNGIIMKFSFRYLILKRFFTLRSFLKQNNLDNKDEDQFDLQINDSKTMPHGLIEETGLLKMIIDIIIGIVLLYAIIFIPINLFFQYSTEGLDIVEKLIDCLFFCEMLLRMRTVYRDKSNNLVIDLNLIFIRYFEGLFFIDMLSCIPWDYFFMKSNGVYIISVKFVRSIFKILRIGKLAPIIQRIESMKGAHIFRLLKLFFILFIAAHWMGAILFSTITSGIDWTQYKDSCYTSKYTHNKNTITLSCAYVVSLYSGAYLIPGQNPSTIDSVDVLRSSSEYIVFIFEYMIGSMLSAYIVGGMSSIILNMNQGQNFFTSKIDLLNEHMTFYEISDEIQKDVRIYYDYLWLRHKDVVYGKHHFELLSNSLRQKFEKYNLPGNDLLLATFYNLNIGNSKLIGQILMDLKKTIVFPYEILIEEGSVTTGIYILFNGLIELTNVILPNLPKKTYECEFNTFYSNYLKQQIENEKIGIVKSKGYLDESYCMMFPLLPSVIKTGRNWQRAFSKDFADLLFLPINSFDKLVENFPIEIHIFKQKVVKEVQEKKLFENIQLFKMISQHSSRSVEKYYEETFNTFNIWIPIPIPISQRKIAKNYINCFIKKVKNHTREILVEGDINICLNSIIATRIISTNIDKTKDEKKNADQMEELKHLSLRVNNICEKVYKELERQFVEED